MNANEMSSKSNPRLKRIQKVSHTLSKVAFAGMILILLALLLCVLFSISLFIVEPKQKSDVLFLVEIFVTGIFLFFNALCFYRFFDRLKNGHLFDAKTISYLEKAGQLFVILSIFEVILSIAGKLMFQMKMTLDVGSLFSGLSIIFVAWLLREAQVLQEESELTV